MKPFLIYEGCNMLRTRLVLAVLSGKSVKIRKIRFKDDNPGLREFEASFLRILDEITNGSRIEISETGTALYFQPGLLHGGRIELDCNPQRSLGYYLEPLICLAPFCKNAVEARLKGVTNDETDPSVDVIKFSTMSILKQFLGTDEHLELKIISRGVKPTGGGEIVFRCPTRKQLRPLQLIKESKIKRIRGVAFTVCVSPTMANRMVEVAKGILLDFIPDIYIYTDHTGKGKVQRSPGFGISLVAETINGTFLTAEIVSKPLDPENPFSASNPSSVPEDLGKKAAYMLLEEVFRGGCVDSSNQSLSALFMTLGPKDVNKVLMGPLSPYTMEFLRHIRDYFGLVFKLEAKSDEDDEELNIGAKKVVMTCVGVGFTNLSKTTIFFIQINLASVFMKSAVRWRCMLAVSSVLNKDVKQFGKKYIFDNRDDTCWNSDQGSPQWILIEFPSAVEIREIHIQFQGGFSGKDCWLEGKFEVTPVSLKYLKLIFNSSTDFFGS
uniref:F5/8 type C domain-containing protein n=1 Tax=Strigamia maritima TaxID=126957 RepID=T1IWQ7_STRMM